MKSKKQMMSVAVVLIIATLLGGCVTPPMTVSVQLAETPAAEPVAPDPVEPDPWAEGTATRGVVQPVQFRAVNVAQDLSVGGTVLLEGTTQDAFETTVTLVDPTADRTITLPDSDGTVALNPYGASIEFEGATANDYETTVTVVDPTADRTITVPDATGTVRLDRVLLKTANYVASVADATGVVINTTNAMTVTLPAVAAGLNLCVFNGDGADIKIDPPGTNTILALTNGNGDRLTNTTIGDSVCLVGLNTSSWMAMERVGTWSDGN